MQKRHRTLSRHLSERSREGGETAASAGDLLGKLKDVFEQVAQAASEFAQAESSEQKADVPFTLGGKQGRMVFGYTMRMGLDGLQAEPFGNVPPVAQKRGEKTAPATRAPITDVFEEAGIVRVIAEMPGVTEADVICSIDGTRLRIETRGGHRYGKTLDLPAPVDPASLKLACRNGILEISITRMDAQA